MSKKKRRVLIKRTSKCHAIKQTFIKEISLVYLLHDHSIKYREIKATLMKENIAISEKDKKICPL